MEDCEREREEEREVAAWLLNVAATIYLVSMKRFHNPTRQRR